ncbi:hypothetical protein [Virgibacillus halodenitrificans]|nr:hypothetical protein [Virgibacillus halodenitrificans]
MMRDFFTRNNSWYFCHLGHSYRAAGFGSLFSFEGKQAGENATKV